MKIQKRKSISVRGPTYDRLRDYASAAGRSMSDVAEDVLAQLFAKLPGGASETAPSRVPTRRRLDPISTDREQREKEAAVDLLQGARSRGRTVLDIRAGANAPGARPAPAPMQKMTRTGGSRLF